MFTETLICFIICITFTYVLIYIDNINLHKQISSLKLIHPTGKQHIYLYKWVSYILFDCKFWRISLTVLMPKILISLLLQNTLNRIHFVYCCTYALHEGISEVYYVIEYSYFSEKWRSKVAQIRQRGT